ncbi:MAG TPA: hypothetical protein VD813_08520 [Pseudonocardia sp.]|nr:hypothetical protein [Pseudonocardia sp.]
MSQQTSGRYPATGPGSPDDRPTTHVARDEAADVGRTTAESGKQVAGTAAEQARHVAHEAGTQARDLVGEARTQVRDQARNGQQKAAGTLRSLADELEQMAQGSSQSGPAAEVAKQAADRVRGVADWVGRREPGDLIEEVRRFARRRPGAFLLGAAAAGVLAGRLTRGVSDASSGGPSGRGQDVLPARNGYGEPGYPAPTPMPYERPGGAALPPQGPIGAPPEPRPYAPGTSPAGGPPPGPPPMGGPGPAGPIPGRPGPAGPRPGGPPPVPPRTGPTTVGEYVEDLERGTGRHEYGGPR